MSDALGPHGLQHARLPCPSLSPGVCSNSCLSSQWCHPTISSSVVPISSCPQSFLASESFPMNQFFASGSQSIEASASTLVLPYKYSGFTSFSIDWFALLAVQGTLGSLLQHHKLKASILQHSPFFIVQLLHAYMTTGKTMALTIWVSKKVMFFLFNMMSRFVIVFLIRSNCLLISWLQSLSTVIWSQRKKKTCNCFYFHPPSVCYEVLGPNAMILVFECWVLSQLFHSPLSSSRGSLVPLYFLPLERCHLHIWGCWYFSWQSWFHLCDSSSVAFA